MVKPRNHMKHACFVEGLPSKLNILWMEEFLHHFGWLKPSISWDKPPIKHCRISSIHSSYGKSRFIMANSTLNGPFSICWNAEGMLRKRTQVVASDVISWGLLPHPDISPSTMVFLGWTSRIDGGTWMKMVSKTPVRPLMSTVIWYGPAAERVVYKPL